MLYRRPALMFAAAAVLAAAGAPATPQDTPSPPAPRVEVRVHVTDRGAFQDGLELKDFSLLEDGRVQSISSLTLVRSGGVARFEGAKATLPRVDRSYTLLFQAVDWDPKLVQAIEYLFERILQPGDAMTLVTPFKPYRLQPDALAHRSKDELVKGMGEVLRNDISLGGGEYRDLLNDLKRLTRAISGPSSTSDVTMSTDPDMESFGEGTVDNLQMQLERYRTTLIKLDGIRLVDESKLEAFAESLREAPGQKTVVFFYQREYRPEINAGTMNRLMALYQENFDILQNLTELFQFYKREKRFDAERVKRAFADAGVEFHFIFMERKSQRVSGVTMREQSEDIYPGFVEVARASGGTAESSQNPAASFQRAADVSNDHYILTYVPDAFVADGGFRTIEVRVNRPGCQVSHRLGYYAK